MRLSVQSLPNLEVAVQVGSVLGGQGVADSCEDVVLVGHEVLPELESEELVVHVS